MKNAPTNLIPIPDDDGQQPPGGIPPKHPVSNAIIKEVQTSFLEHDGKIYEEVYKDGEASFVCWDGQNVTNVDSVNTPKAIYVPIKHALIHTGAMPLPEQAQDYSSTANLIAEIKDFIHGYIDISSAEEEFAVLYVLNTYLYDKASVCPILRFLGDTGFGKTRCLEIIGRLCYKPIQTSGATTTAAIYRLINKFKGTLVIDEADFKGSGAQEDITKLLNCGFQRLTAIYRSKKDDALDVNSYASYGPRLLASRKTYEDQALESRCVTFLMELTDRKDIPKVLPLSLDAKQTALRNKLLMYRLKNFSQMIFTEVNLTLKNSRISQVFQPIANQVKDDPVLLKRLDSFAAEYECKSLKTQSDSPEGWVVNALVQLVDSGEKLITPSDINAKIVEVYGDDFKKLMTAIKVGRILHSLGIEVSLKKVNGTAKRLVIIDAAKLEKLRKKYVMPVDNEPDDELNDEPDYETDEDFDEGMRRYSNDSNGGNGWEDLKQAWRNQHK